MASAGHSPALPLPSSAHPARGRRALTIARRAVGVLSLATVAACTLHLVAAAASHPILLVPARRGGMPAWLRGPLDEIGYFLFPRDYGIAMAVMAGAWLLALLTATDLPARLLFGVIVAVHAILFLGPPLASADVFGYLDWARMGVLYDLNPYVTDSAAVVSDPVYRFVGWDNLTSPYGPLFTLLTYALVPLGLAGSLWALKALVIASSLACAALIWRTALALDIPAKPAVVLYGLNPAVLVYAVGGFHNDAMMMLVLMGAIHLAVTGRERLGAVAGAGAVAIKSSAGLVLPFMLIGARDRPGWLKAGLGAGVAVLAVGLLAFGASALNFLNVLGTQQALNSGSSVPAQLGAWLGWEGSPTGVRIVFSALGVAAIGLCLWRAWRGADWITSAGWATLSLMVTSSWLLAWYVIWLVPLAALSRSRALRAGAMAMTVFVIAVRVVPFYD